MKLNDLKIGENAVITEVNAQKNFKKRLLDIGVIKGSKISPVLCSGNSIVAYYLKGAVIAIRKDDTKDIKVEVVI